MPSSRLATSSGHASCSASATISRNSLSVSSCAAIGALPSRARLRGSNLAMPFSGGGIVAGCIEPSTWAASSTTCKRTCSGSGRDRPSPAELIRLPLADWPFKIRLSDKGTAGAFVVSALRTRFLTHRRPLRHRGTRSRAGERQANGIWTSAWWPLYDWATTDEGGHHAEAGRPACRDRRNADVHP